VVSSILVETMERMDLKYPKPIEDIEQYVIPEV
jgi:hypothetical protein